MLIKLGRERKQVKLGVIMAGSFGKIDEKETLSLVKKLVSVNSVNPCIEKGKGEIEISKCIAEYLEKVGLEVRTQEVVDGRFNVIATLKGSGNGRNLMFNGHTDTVGIRNMSIDPLNPVVENGRLHGRGACDMKGPIAAIMIAIRTLAESRVDMKGCVSLSTVVGEEFDNVGANKLVTDKQLAKLTQALIVAEPTALQLAIKHKGFANLEVEVEGKAAHGSVPEKGIDAIEKAAKIILEIENLKKEFALKKDPLLGQPKIHSSTIEGGREWSVVPDRCVVRFEIRTIPGYATSQAVEDVERIISELAKKDPDLKAKVGLFLSGEPLNTSPEDPMIKGLKKAIKTVKAVEPQIIGLPFYTEAAIFAKALSIPACIIGPGDIAQAHSADEFVKMSEVIEAARIYALTACDFVNQ
jgi:acetylornithine deacetylase/succinyl-diaminopimelate desuccinylase family protein